MIKVNLSSTDTATIEKPAMNRTLIFACMSLAVWMAGTTLAHAQSTEGALIPQTEAERAGLKRAWFAQVPLDVARSKISHIDLQAGLLLVITDESMLHVFDPETGLRLWSFQAGRRRYVAQSAGANATHVAVANNARLFVLDRDNGNLVFTHLMTGTPDRGPVLTDHHVMIPLVKGPVETYPLDIDFKELLSPLYLPSAGRMIGEPAVADAGLVYAGDAGLLNGHRFSDQGPQFTMTVTGGVSSGPALFAPRVYIGTEAGYLIAYDTKISDEVWRFAAGSPVHQKPVALGSVVYVLPLDGGMFALRPESGDTQWFAADPIQFVAASLQRVYTIDKLRQLAILDGKTGARIDTLRLPQTVKALMNDRSDRIFLCTDSGLIQCLHEPGLAQPHLYVPPKPEAPKKGSGSQKPAATPAPAAAPVEQAPAAG